MNEIELKQLWQTANEKLAHSLVINRQNTEDIMKLKVQNFVSSMKPIKIFTLVVGILWVMILGGFLAGLAINHIAEISMFFLLSAGLQVVFTAIAVGVYLYQLVLINQVDFSKPVLDIQQKLAQLKISTLLVTRLLFLQLPLWTTFYWNDKMFVAENLLLWILQGIVTLFLTFLSVWLFFNIKYENRNKKWFQWIFSGKEWQPILLSMDLLNQIEQYEEESR